jgi:signal transduction histidine kinase
MDRRGALRLAWGLWAASVAAGGLALGLWATSGFPPLPRGDGLEPPGGPAGAFARIAYVLTFVAVSTLGLALVARRPAMPLGWIWCGAGALVVGALAAGEYASAAAAGAWTGALGGRAGASWLQVVLGALSLALVGPVLLLFPSGRLPSPRWRPVLWLAVAGPLVAAAAAAVQPGPLGNGADNPLGVAGAARIAPPVGAAGRYAFLVGALLGVASLFARLRRARGEERQQLKWVVYAAALWIAALRGLELVPLAWQWLTPVAYVLALDGFVLALGVAVLRYRLYAIDLVVSRTLAYGALAAGIAAVYAAVVAGAGAVVGARGAPGPAPSLLAAALVALLFQPLRARAERLANRLVYGQRASPYEVLAGFSGRLAGALTLDEVLPRTAEAAARGVGAAAGRARVFLGDGRERAAWWPAGGVPAGCDAVVPVRHRGVPVGEVAVAKPPGEPLTPTEAALLGALAAQAGPALENVRLAAQLEARLAELAARAEELRASRERIVAAQDAERRRLERDVHDGAQQHLVALAITLGLARAAAGPDPGGRLAALLDELDAQAREALATLRDLARGIYPPLLADRGLVAALGAHLAKTRPGAAVEDGGPGFDPGRGPPGSGLVGMADRVAALGGALAVESAPGRGTTVAGRVPLGREPAGIGAQSEADA